MIIFFFSTNNFFSRGMCHIQRFYLIYPSKDFKIINIYKVSRWCIIITILSRLHVISIKLMIFQYIFPFLDWYLSHLNKLAQNPPKVFFFLYDFLKKNGELTLLHSKASALCSSFCRKQLLHFVLLNMLGTNFLHSALMRPVDIFSPSEDLKQPSLHFSSYTPGGKMIKKIYGPARLIIAHISL